MGTEGAEGTGRHYKRRNGETEPIDAAESEGLIDEFTIFGPMRIVPVGPLAYAVGAVALGAQSMGHEYAFGMLGTFLAQPGDRRRMLLIKESVLAVMLFSLLAIAAATPLNASDGHVSVMDRAILIVTPTL